MEHVRPHLAQYIWAWILGLMVLGAVALSFRFTPGAFLFMLSGLLIMMQSEGTLLAKPEEPEVTAPAQAPLPMAEAA